MKTYTSFRNITFCLITVAVFAAAWSASFEAAAQGVRRIYRMDTVCRGETGYHITRQNDTLFFETFDNGLPASWIQSNYLGENVAGQNGSGFNAVSSYNIYGNTELPEITVTESGLALFEYPLGPWPASVEEHNDINHPELLDPTTALPYASLIAMPRINMGDPRRTTVTMNLFIASAEFDEDYGEYAAGSVLNDEIMLSCYNFGEDNTTRINSTPLFNFNSAGNETLDLEDWAYFYTEPGDLNNLAMGEAQCRFAHINRGSIGFGVDSVLIIGPRRVDIPSEVTLAALGTSLTTEQTYIVDGYDTTIVVTTWYIGTGVASYGPALDTAVCDSLVWQYGNRSEATSNQPVVVGVNRCGGDSIRLLTLAVNHSLLTTATNVVGASQMPYTWGGVVFTEGGTLNDTLTDRHGCDSVVAKTLTVLPPTEARTIERYDTICPGETGYHITRYLDTLLYEDFDHGTPSCWTISNADLNGSGFNALAAYDIYGIPDYYGSMTALEGLTLFEYPLGAWTVEAENLISHTSLTPSEQLYLAQFISMASTPRFVVADPSRTTMKMHLFCAPNTVYGDAVWADGNTFHDEIMLSCYNFDADNTTRINSSALFHFNSNGNEYIDDDYWYLLESEPTDFNTLTPGAEAQCRLAHVNRGGAGFGIDSLVVIGPRRVDIPTEVTMATPGSSISTTEQVYRTGCTPTTIITHWYIRPRDTYGPTIDTTVCDSLVWQYGTRYLSTVAEPIVVATNGCGGDSIITLNLTVNYRHDSVMAPQTFCSSVEWNGTTYTDNTTDTKHFFTVMGHCDSTITATFVRSAADTVNIAETICAGVTYTFNGNDILFHTDTVYRDSTAVMRNIAGCDSITFLTLTVNAPLTGDTVAAACESFAWNGTTYAADTVVQRSMANAAGCDSIVTLHLTINHATASEDTITACESYTWEGVPVTADTTITQVTTNAAQCDSTATTHIIIQQDIVVLQPQTACDSFLWDNGTTYYADAVAQRTVAGVGTCDTIFELHLTIKHATTATIDTAACDAFAWIDGQTYTASTSTAQHTTTNIAGCDSVVTLHLTINHSATHDSTITECDSIVWQGVTYTDNDDVQTTLSTIAGCDSVVTVHLTVRHSTTYTSAFTACKRYVWNGIVITSDTTVIQRDPTPAGCDNIGTIYIDIRDTVHDFSRITTCDHISWNGRMITADTVVYDTLRSVESCDTFMRTNIVVHHVSETTLYAAACDRYIWNGIPYTSDQSVQKRLYNTHGCDSIVTMNITIKHGTTGDTSATVCDKFSWYEHQAITSSRNDLTHRLRAANGCDSVVTLHLTVNHGSNVIDYQTACDTYTWIDGNTYGGSTAFPSIRRRDVNGCDSIITLNLTLNHSTVRHDTVRTGEPFVWHGHKYDTTGNYRHNNANANSVGCDSLEVLHLIVSPEYMRPKIKCYELKNLLMVDHFPAGPGTKRVDYGGYRWYRGDHAYGQYSMISGANKDYYCDTLNGRYLPLGGCYFVEALVAGTYMHSDTICINSGKSLLEPLTLSIYPNPVAAGRLVTISTTGVDDDGTIDIYDMLGRLVLQMPAAEGDNYITVETTGTYTLILRKQNGETVARKLVVK